MSDEWTARSCGLILLAFLCVQDAAAAQYPARPIRLIVPSAAGSAADVNARLLVAELVRQRGQQIVVDNRPGAAGSIGMELIARAVPDGYTIGYGTLPTIDEAGVPGFELTAWGGVVVPAGVPKTTVGRLNAEVNRALASPSLKEKVALFGYEVGGGTPEPFDAFVKKEAARWADVIKRTGVKAD